MVCVCVCKHMHTCVLCAFDASLSLLHTLITDYQERKKIMLNVEHRLMLQVRKCGVGGAPVWIGDFSQCVCPCSINFVPVVCIIKGHCSHCCTRVLSLIHVHIIMMVTSFVAVVFVAGQYWRKSSSRICLSRSLLAGQPWA